MAITEITGPIACSSTLVLASCWCPIIAVTAPFPIARPFVFLVVGSARLTTALDRPLLVREMVVGRLLLLTLILAAVSPQIKTGRPVGKK